MVSLYSLQNLYNQGILDYVPTELASGPNVSSLAGMQNPYLNMAAQGNLYQTAGMTPDSFSYSGANLGFHNGTAGHANTGHIGMNSNFYDSQAGLNGFGGVNGNILINNSSAGMNAFGGGFGKLGQAISNTPNAIKGLVAGGIIVGTTLFCFKKGKKAPTKVQQESFLSKLKFLKK